MLHILVKRWPLVLLVVVFVVFKLPYLHDPFYWDESWPYASAVQHMYMNGPSILPGSIDPELSRGHPLFFHFSAACWMCVFGRSILSLHAFALFISVLVLVFVYEITLTISDKKSAFIVTLLLASEQIFFVQSSMLLLEMLLALCGFASIYFYYFRRYIPAATTLTLLLYTKETGAVVVGTLAIFELYRIFKNRNIKESIPGMLALAVPCILIAVFFQLQKNRLGWYVFPLYSGLMEHTWELYFQKVRLGLWVLFYDGWRNNLFLFFALCIFVAGVYYKRKNYFAILAPVVALFLIISDEYSKIFPRSFLVLFAVLSILFCLYYLLKSNEQLSVQKKKYIFLNGVFVVLFILISAMNLCLTRYYLIALIPLLFMTAMLVYTLLPVFKTRIVYSLLVSSILVINALSYIYTQGLGDVELGAHDGAMVHKDVVDFLLRKKYQGKPIASGAYLERIHLTDPYSGFIANPADSFTNVNWDMDVFTQVAIFDNIEPDYRYQTVVSDTSFKCIFKTKRGEAWAEIYYRDKYGAYTYPN